MAVRGAQGRSSMRGMNRTRNAPMTSSVMSLPANLGKAGMRRRTNTVRDMNEAQGLNRMTSHTGGGPAGGARVTLRS